MIRHAMHDDLINRAVRASEARFGRSPDFGAIAPGRVNLIGEHTDYNEGFVLPIAIDRATVIVASVIEEHDGANDQTSTLVAADFGREVALNLRRPLEPIPRDAPASFANYILGVVEEFHALEIDVPNLNMLACSTIPIGAGLSSSAAIEVAAAFLLERITRSRLDPLEKALLCQRAEHAFPGTPCGIMDMYASILAKADHALLIDCRTNEARPIPLPPVDDMSLIVIDTGVKHDLASGEYAERRRVCRSTAQALGVTSLRDATIAMLDDAREEGRIDDTAHRLAAHVVMENVRTLLAAQSMMTGDIPAFCAQMFESHKSLRNLYEVSCAELDMIVDTCWQVREETGDDRIGARMTGGGFGGCAIAYCPRERAAVIAEVIVNRFSDAFDREPTTFFTRASEGARTLELNK